MRETYRMSTDSDADGMFRKILYLQVSIPFIFGGWVNPEKKIWSYTALTMAAESYFEDHWEESFLNSLSNVNLTSEGDMTIRSS